VLVALHDELLNGATISVLRAVPLLRRRGWRFAFWVPRPGPAATHLEAAGETIAGAARPIVSGIRALRQPPGPVRRLAATPAYLRSFTRSVRELAPDLVHANSLYSFAEALAAKRTGVPTLLHLHDMAPAGRKAGIARAVCRRVDLSIAVSHACAASYAVSDWSPPVVHEAAPVPASPVEIRSNPEPFVIGTVGVISRRKGSDLFVAAAERMQGSNIRFRLVGAPSDPLDRDWAGEVLARGASVGVEHVRSAEVEAELRGWDAFVLPSRRDPFPISMLEAMGLGLPVIGARTDGIAEQITPESGVLVAGDDSGALADAILRVRQMPADVRAALGANARARVAENFSLDHQADGIDGAYRSVLSGDGPE
jgi:glycosyltransferase involved in cell wall biosynthesis